MTAAARPGSGQNHDLQFLLICPTWVTDTQILEPSSTDYPRTLIGSCIGNQVAGTWNRHSGMGCRWTKKNCLLCQSVHIFVNVSFISRHLKGTVKAKSKVRALHYLIPSPNAGNIQGSTRLKPGVENWLSSWHPHGWKGPMHRSNDLLHLGKSRVKSSIARTWIGTLVIWDVNISCGCLACFVIVLSIPLPSPWLSFRQISSTIFVGVVLLKWINLFYFQ